MVTQLRTMTTAKKRCCRQPRFSCSSVAKWKLYRFLRVSAHVWIQKDSKSGSKKAWIAFHQRNKAEMIVWLEKKDTWPGLLGYKINSLKMLMFPDHWTCNLHKWTFQDCAKPLMCAVKWPQVGKNDEKWRCRREHPSAKELSMAFTMTEPF